MVVFLYMTLFPTVVASHFLLMDVTLISLEGVVKHSTTLTRSYSSALIKNLVPLELDHVDHATTNLFAKTKVA